MSSFFLKSCQSSLIRMVATTAPKCSRSFGYRYLSEYDFRYNNRAAIGVDDESRAAVALRGVVGKRLTYKTVGGVNA